MTTLEAKQSAEMLRREIEKLVREYQHETGMTVQIVKCHTTEIENITIEIAMEVRHAG